MAFVNIPGLDLIFQSNFLARYFEEGLDSNLAYRRTAIQELLPENAGQTLTKTRIGRLTPVPTALNPSTLYSGLDNGFSPALPSFEQYTYNIQAWGASLDVNLMAAEAEIADTFKAFSRTNGVQAAQTLERVAKQNIFAAYNGGNTFVRTDLGASTGTSCHVDDIRGFQYVPVNGQMVPVSGSNPLTVQEVASTAGGFNQTFQVTAATADSPSQSAYPGSSGPGSTDGISGVLTIQAIGGGSVANDPANGDAIISSIAAQVVRPDGKTATTQLAAGDALTLGLIQDAVTVLRNNAVPPMPDNTYHLILDNTSMRQVFADQQWIAMSATRMEAPEFKDSQVFRMMGCTFIPSTEAYIQSPNSTAGVNVTVHRPILMGAESLLQGTFAGLETWQQREGLDSISNIVLVDNIAHIIRAPLDRAGLSCSLSWLHIGAFAVPTDMTAVPDIIPTASNAAYKRCVVLETA